MAKCKVKIRETFECNYPKGTLGIRKMWIVSHNGHSQVYYDKKTARIAKAELEKQ